MVAEVSKRAVWAAGAALVALALIGAFQGWRSTAEEGDVSASSEGLLPTTNPIAAKNAAAFTEAAGGLTEAQIRSIARQEAQAVINGPSTPAEPRPTTTTAPVIERAPAVQIVPAPAPNLNPAPAVEPPPLF